MRTKWESRLASLSDANLGEETLITNQDFVKDQGKERYVGCDQGVYESCLRNIRTSIGTEGEKKKQARKPNLFHGFQILV